MIKKVRGLIDEKLLRYIVVGGINTCVGMFIMFGLYNVVGCSYWVSSAANYTITSVLSFFLNRYFTFRSKGHIGRQAFRFAVNIAVCYILAYGIARPLTMLVLSGAEQSFQENVAMVVGMVFFSTFNYLGQRLFAFRTDDSSHGNL